jgi:hypothetical protein
VWKFVGVLGGSLEDNLNILELLNQPHRLWVWYIIGGAVLTCSFHGILAIGELLQGYMLGQTVRMNRFVSKHMRILMCELTCDWQSLVLLVRAVCDANLCESPYWA